ncbi:MAG: hypothetical protein KJ985_00230 [Proteobacteria bacterium]|nr:hypothetical protein [Pseudomonadota bacterium]
MPGLHEAAPPAQMLKLRPEKVVCIPLLEIQVDPFEDVGAMVSPYAFNLKMFAMRTFLGNQTDIEKKPLIPFDYPASIPEPVTEESARRCNGMKGVMGEKDSRSRPGGFFLRPDDTVRKRHPHPVGPIVIVLVADPAEYDGRLQTLLCRNSPIRPT